MTETNQRKCEDCGSEYEYSKLLDCMQCPKCTSKMIVPFFMAKMLKDNMEEKKG